MLALTGPTWHSLFADPFHHVFIIWDHENNHSIVEFRKINQYVVFSSRINDATYIFVNEFMNWRQHGLANAGTVKLKTLNADSYVSKRFNQWSLNRRLLNLYFMWPVMPRTYIKKVNYFIYSFVQYTLSPPISGAHYINLIMELLFIFNPLTCNFLLTRYEFPFCIF